MKRRAVFAILAALPACTPPPERVTVEMIWIDPPTPYPGTPVPHEPDTVDLAFATTPNHHIFVPSAPMLAMLRAKGKRKVQATFDVTRRYFSSEVHGYTLIAVEGTVFEQTPGAQGGSAHFGGGDDPPPFTQ